MSKKEVTFSITFEADTDWHPLEPACWFYCPFSSLTKLNHVCNAYEAYEKYKLIVCPLVRNGIN